MTDAPPQPAPLAAPVRWAGLLLILIGAFLHATAIIEPLPYWDLDPSRMTPTVAGLTPASSMLVDVVMLLGAAAALLGERLARRTVPLLPLLLYSLGAAGVLLHSFRDGTSLEHLRLGSTWIAAMAAGLAAHHLARDDRTARFIAAVAVGFLAVLAAKGALELLVEHPSTLANYRAHRETFLAAQGWTPDSTMARTFERRLLQPEATGWFGLANVFATFAAASTVALLGLAALAWALARRPAQLLPDGLAGLVTLGFAAAAASVWMAGSKAGFAVSILGVAFWTAAIVAHRFPAGGRLPRLLGPACAVAAVAVPLAAIVLRGFIGERSSEPSLLFRSFYLRGAARVFADHPLIGVGPAGFKDAYLIAKPPLSPEEVTSAHNLIADFGATLGLLGLAWVGLVLLWVWRAGLALTAQSPLDHPRSSRETTPTHEGRTGVRLVIAVSAAAILLSAWLQVPEATPESAIMRVAALVAWIGLAISLLAVMGLAPGWRSAFAASALALAAHLQLDVTPVWPASAPLAMIWLAAAQPARQPRDPAPRRSIAGIAAPILLAGLAAALLLTGVRSAFRWESHLRAAAAAVEPLPMLSARLNTLRTPSAPALIPGDSVSRVHADIAALLSAPSRTRSPDADLAALFLQQARPASRELAAAIDLFPRHAPTLQAASRFAMNAAGTADALDDPAAARRWADLAESLALRATTADVGRAAAWGWLGVVRSTRATLTAEPSHLAAATEAWEQAMTLEPHGPNVPRQLVDAYLAQGDTAKARAWAQRLLQIDDNARLDPLRRLTPDQRARYERLAGS